MLGEKAFSKQVLTQHLDNLEEVQQSHEFEVANLMAENMLLREKLGLKSTEHTQQVMFQNMEKPEPKKKPKRGRNAFQEIVYSSSSSSSYYYSYSYYCYKAWRRKGVMAWEAKKSP